MPNTRIPNDESAQLAIIQRRLVIIALALLIAFLALQVAQTFSDVLRILSISVFCCYMVSGLVDWLEKPFNSRFFAVLAVYIVGAVFTIVSIIILIPALVVQISQFAQATIDHLPAFVDWCGRMLEPLERKLNAVHIYMKPTEFLMSLASSLPKPDGTLIMTQITGVAMGTMTWVFYGLSILILTFYFLLDGARMSFEIVEHFPSTYRRPFHAFLADSDKSLQNFFRGQIVLGFLFGGFMVLVYWALGVQYALALGIILGVWEIVPVIGPTIGFIPACVAVLLQGAENLPGNRLVQVLILIIVFNIFQWLKDNIVAPKYIGNVIGLHPVVIFIAIMIGARLDGMLGIIVALPVACVINVFFKHLRQLHAPLSDAEVTAESDADILSETFDHKDDRVDGPEERAGALQPPGAETANTEKGNA